jgi:hypothetical protein
VLCFIKGFEWNTAITDSSVPRHGGTHSMTFYMVERSPNNAPQCKATQSNAKQRYALTHFGGLDGCLRNKLQRQSKAVECTEWHGKDTQLPLRR